MFEVTVTVTLRMKVNVKDLGEEEIMLLREGEKENLCSLGGYFLIFLFNVI